jgi:hypothetical protein
LQAKADAGHFLGDLGDYTLLLGPKT